MATWRRMSKNDILKTIKSQQMRHDFQYMTHSEILTRIDRMQKSAKYLSEKFGVDHLLPPPSVSNGVAHNHPPLDSLLSLVMPTMSDPSLSVATSIQFPPIKSKQIPASAKEHREEDEGDESSVISNFSSNLPHYVSRSEILKVYDVLPAHKKQLAKEKQNSNHRKDPNHTELDNHRNAPKLEAIKERQHHTKQHGSWSSRASSIMHNPESIYISREEVLRNFQNSNGDKFSNGGKAKRIHDSWSSRASSILAKVNEGQEPTYVSRSQLIGNITGKKNKAKSREDVLKNLEASIAEREVVKDNDMEFHSSECSSSTLSDPDSGSEASTVRNVKLKSRVELPERMKESEVIRTVKEGASKSRNEGKNLKFKQDTQNSHHRRNSQVCRV